MPWLPIYRIFSKANIQMKINRFCQGLTRVLFDDFSDFFRFFFESRTTCRFYVIRGH